MKNLLLILATTSVLQASFSQTVGTLVFENNAAEGYTLLHPMNFDTTYLIDNCGRVVQKWFNHIENKPFAELNSAGNLLCAVVPQNETYFNAGGASGKLIEQDWNGNIVWSYELSNSNKRLHHDAITLPNGNILAILWELKTGIECIQAGRNPSTIVDQEMWACAVYELQPIGQLTNIVWEWHSWDHLVQDYDSTMSNYGNVAQEYQKIDINKGNPGNFADWIHLNGIDYHPDLDLILLSNPMMNEIWIIDHSTNTNESASSTGGNFNKGGDLLWRWGNPAIYNSGDTSNQQLHFQHDARWIKNSNRFNGMISVYDNNYKTGSINQSAVKIVDPGLNTFNNTFNYQGVFMPDTALYTHVLHDTLFSNRISGVEMQPNGNLLILSGQKGHLYELDSNENVAWNYKIPIRANNNFYAQGEPVVGAKSMFTPKKYGANFSGFVGKNMTPGLPIELNPLTCMNTASINSQQTSNNYPIVYPNPFGNLLSVSTGTLSDITIVDVYGRTVLNTKVTTGTTNLVVDFLSSGNYLLHIDKNKPLWITKK